MPVPPYTRDGRQAARRACGSAWSASISAKGWTPRSRRPCARRSSVYESLGATVKEISLPHGKYAVATYYIIAPCEASSNLARYDGVHYGYRTDEQADARRAGRRAQRSWKPPARQPTLDELDNPLVRMYRRSRAEGFGAEVKRRIMLGTYALSAGYYDAYYLKALKVRRLIRQDYDEAFEEVDLIAGPVTPTPAFKIGEKVDDPLAMYLVDLYTVSANLAGIAGIVVPLRLQLGRPADRPAAARPAVRGRAAAARRPHVPAGDRLAHARYPPLVARNNLRKIEPTA